MELRVPSERLTVGMIGLAAFFPLVLFGLYGGSISDTHDRRTVALISSSGLWACAIEARPNMITLTHMPLPLIAVSPGREPAIRQGLAPFHFAQSQGPRVLRDGSGQAEPRIAVCEG